MSNRKTYRNLFRRVLTGGGLRLPSEGLIFKAIVPGLVDSIGESSILYQSGDASTWQTTAVWGFERTAATITIDTGLGGSKLYRGTTPVYMRWRDWMIQNWMNKTYLYLGEKGAAGWGESQAANTAQILRALRGYAVDFDGNKIIGTPDIGAFEYQG